jgi:hypothetical protein
MSALLIMITHTLFKGTMSQDGNCLEGLNILISKFCLCADGFHDLSTAFYYLIQGLAFNCFFEITY